MPAERTFRIEEFKGLNDYAAPTLSTATTRSLNAVIPRFGRILGAKGLSKWGNIATASATTPVIGLLPFYTSSLAGTLYRMTPTKIHQYNAGGSSWDDKTGTDLTGSSSTLPQWVVHKDTLVFVNDGKDRPRKLTGSGNSANIATSTAPYAKAIWQAWGYLFLGNVSTDGSTFVPRRVNYSDDFDVDWSLCDGNELNFNATNGEILAGWPFGDYVVVFKSDALVQLNFIGGKARFTQLPVKGAPGLIAPLSIAPIARIGLPYLGVDYRIHRTDGIISEPAPPFVQRKLDETLYKPRARFAVGLNYPDQDTYSLFYQSSASDSWNRSRISFNYRTGEFFHRQYAGHEFVRVCGFKSASTAALQLVASTNDLVYELDTASESDDGTYIDRYYDTDWTDCGFPGQKYLKGVTLSAVQQTAGRVAISVNADYRGGFVYEKFFDLKGLASAGGYVTVPYRIDPGLKGNVFNVRIALFHDDGTQVEIVPPAVLHYEPVSDSPVATQTFNNPTAKVA